MKRFMTILALLSIPALAQAAEPTVGQKHKVTSAKKQAAKKPADEGDIQSKINERNKAQGAAQKAVKDANDKRDATAKGIAK